jgi:hypothetical protein
LARDFLVLTPDSPPLDDTLTTLIADIRCIADDLTGGTLTPKSAASALNEIAALLLVYDHTR